MTGKIKKEHAQQIFAALFILVLIILIVKGLWRYVGAFFGAGILYVLFHKINRFLRTRTFLGRKGAALATIILTLLIVIVPSYFIISTAVSEVTNAVSDQTVLQSLAQLSTHLPNMGLDTFIKDQLPKATQVVATFLINSISDVTRTVIGLFIMFFLLYFLLIQNERQLAAEIKSLIPFNKQNTERLMQEFATIVNTTIISTGLMALLQGTILAILFLATGVQAAIFWGLLGAFLCFIPIVGPALIWVPVVLIEFSQGRVAPAIITIIGGLFIANIDNLLRPFVNKKIGRINEVTSLLGIFMGLAVFGIIGVIIGPIIISFFVLAVKMYQEEYVKG